MENAHWAKRTNSSELPVEYKRPYYVPKENELKWIV
jgi:hypothetical protein